MDMPVSEFPKPLNCAHRGARSLAPENTLAAARQAYESGADLWELDVAVSQDGELVIVHDNSLLRTSNVQQVFPQRASLPAHAFSLAELRRLDFGSWFNQRDPFGQIEAGAVTHEMQISYVGLPIPTLHEALSFTRDHSWRINVEIKDASGTPGDAFVVEKAVALIEELDMVEQVVISSFNHSYLLRVKAACPALSTAALVGTTNPDPLALVSGLGAQAYNPCQDCINPDEILALRRAGIDVNIWTVNDVSRKRELISGGASCIITDFPQVLSTLLAG
jgi:glycerophosphoryl diester phosphodiesterase